MPVPRMAFIREDNVRVEVPDMVRPTATNRPTVTAIPNLCAPNRATRLIAEVNLKNVIYTTVANGECFVGGNFNPTKVAFGFEANDCGQTIGPGRLDDFVMKISCNTQQLEIINLRVDPITTTRFDDWWRDIL